MYWAHPILTLFQMAMVPSFMKVRDHLSACIEVQIAQDNRLLAFVDSPTSNADYFLDDITEASFADIYESPMKRLKWNTPESIDVPPTDPGASDTSGVSNLVHCTWAIPVSIGIPPTDAVASGTRVVRNVVHGDTRFSRFYGPNAVVHNVLDTTSDGNDDETSSWSDDREAVNEYAPLHFVGDTAGPGIAAADLTDTQGIPHNADTDHDGADPPVDIDTQDNPGSAEESPEAATRVGDNDAPQLDTAGRGIAAADLTDTQGIPHHADTATQENPGMDDTAPSVITTGRGTAAAASGDGGQATHPGAAVNKRFRDPVSFREYFEARTKIMRELLVQYTTAATGEAICKGPSFHLPLQVPDDAIAPAFFTAFTYECFGIDAGRHVALDSGTVRTIQEALDACYADQLPKYNSMVASMNACKARMNAATKAAKRQVHLELPAKQRALNNVSHYLRAKTKTLTADGGDTNGELTRDTAEKLLACMMEKHGLGDSSTLMDGGANYNWFVAVAAQMTGCRGFGIEYVPVRTLVAASSFLLALEDKDNKGHLVNPRVAYVTCDLFNLRSVEPTTHVYFFDEAFDTLLHEHNIRVCANTSTLTHIMSFKASKNKSLHRIFEEYGFTKVDQVKVTKTGSLESNTVYIYQRTSVVAVCWPETGGNILTQQRLLADSLEPAWDTCQDTRRKLYQGIKTTTEDLLEAHKRSRKTRMARIDGKKTSTQPRGKCSSLMWWQCARACTTCDHVFQHRPDAVRAGESGINHTGLFAAEDILANTMVIQYTGRWLKEPKTTAEEGRYTAKLNAHSYIDACDDEGAHKYVNHSCTPNGRLLRWTCKENVERLSIQAVRQLKRGDEITVDYSNTIPRPFHCTCSTCAPTRPVVLCLGMVFCDVADTDINVDVDALVTARKLHVIDGRDTVRCIAMEAHSKVDVYTLDKRLNQSHRHIATDFKNRHMIQDIRRVITVPIQQICLDYVYMPNSWTETMGNTLFAAHLRDFASLLSHDGCVYFPYQRDCLAALLKGEPVWQAYYDVSFAHKDDPEAMEANLLFAGTNRISTTRMNDVYQKTDHQEEVYCIVPSTELIELLAGSHPSQLRKLLHGTSTTRRFIRLGKKTC
jgi:hypothetical protein